MVDKQRRDAALELGDGGKRHLRAVRAGDIDLIEIFRVLLEMRRDLEDDAVLVALRVDLGYLRLR
jgi:hypothetical protein